MRRDVAGRNRVGNGQDAYLFHDTGFALGESDVATRLILDKLDLDLAALAAGLVVVVVVVVHVLGRPSALDTAADIGSQRVVAIAGSEVVVAG